MPADPGGTMTETSTAGEGRMTALETTVLESVVETADTRTLVLDAGRGAMDWTAGQYVSIDPHQFKGLASFVAYLEQQKGRKEAPRAYSMCSAPDEPYLAITIKEETFQAGRTKYPPLLSGYLVHQVRAGDTMIVRGFAGAYVLPPDIESRTDHILHLCAGSGSVPDVSIIKDSLRRHGRLRHTLIYSNRTWDDVIFRDMLAGMEREHPGRLRVIHTLTRPAGMLPPGVRSGRVDADMLRGVLAREPETLVYACGPAVTVWDRRAHAAAGTPPPPQFLEAMLAHLAALDVPRSRIKLEAFG
jgi:3-ketosteroid 9alpha-monooxygenase subunit B